jgi:putative membrane protein
MKIFTRAAFVLGLAAFCVLVLRNDVQSIAGLLRQAGWLLLCLIPLHCVPLGLDVMGWRVLVLERSRFSTLFAIACIREAINRLLPVANVGGEVVGARLLVLRGISYPAAVGSILVETTLNILSQILFVTLGLACLFHTTDRFELTGALILAVAGAAAIGLLLFWILRSGAFFRLIHRLAARMLGANPKYSAALGALAQVDSTTRALTAAHGRLVKSIAWQVSGLISGCAETWLVLRWLGHPLSLEGAVALESVTLAARSFFFFAPAGLGVQEAGLVGIGSLLGLGSDVAIALSLAKRAREVLFGLPALAAWQILIGARPAGAPTGLFP